MSKRITLKKLISYTLMCAEDDNNINNNKDDDKDDNTNEGLIHESKPIFSVTFNPEASPGALDMRELIFNKFIKFMEV